MDTPTGAHRRPLPSWILPAAGGVAAVVAVTVLLVVQGAGNAACAAPAPLAAPPTAGAAKTGKATYFDGSKGGNCSYGPPSTDLYVALGPQEYSAGAACGGHLDVTGPRGTVRVKVVDQCPECAPGHLDLSRAAFSRIGNVGDGIIAITYRGVQDPPLPGALQVRVKEGSSAYWLAVLADHHGNPLRSVELRTSSGWQALQRTDYNYWIDENGAGGGPYTLRLTDVYGRQATAGGVTLSPARIQSTGVHMYGAAPARSSTRPSAPASASAGPSPTVSTMPASPAQSATVAPEAAPSTPQSTGPVATC